MPRPTCKHYGDEPCPLPNTQCSAPACFVMPPTLRIGAMLYGYCGGAFGRDSYDDKRVEALGEDWVVVRAESGQVEFATGPPEDLLPYTTKADPDG